MAHGQTDPLAAVGDLYAQVRQSLRWLLTWIALCVALAVAFVLLVQPEYEATTQIVLEQREPVVSGSGAEQSISNLGPTLDSARADSEVNVIKSERVLRFVFDTLGLQNDPSYADGPPGLLGKVKGLIPRFSHDTLTSEELAAQGTSRAFQKFADKIAVKRVGQSYVIEASFRAPSPSQAARLANAITASYIRQQVLFRAATIQRQVEFLQDKTSAIKAELDSTVQAVKSGVLPDVQFADADAHVVSAAQEPLSKAFPQTALVLLLAIVVGLFTGVGAILVRSKLDRRIRSRQQIAQVFDLAPVSVLPRFVDRRPPREARTTLPLASALGGGGSQFIDGLRMLRTTILSSQSPPHHLTIGIVSWAPREGRSTVAIHLAGLISASRDSVMLVDADICNPTLSRVLAPEAKHGLDEALFARATLATPLAVPLSQRLGFFPAVAGSKTSTLDVFLGSAEMHDLLRRLHKDHDVIVDLPPMSISSDTQAIGHLLDGVVLLVEANRTTIDDLRETVRTLEAANTRILSIVLNKAPKLAASRVPFRRRPALA